MKLKTLVLGIVMAISTPLAMAEGSGFYGAIDVGQGTIPHYCDGNPAGISCGDTSTNYRLSAGYQATPIFGVEASYVNDGSLTSSGLGISATSKNTEWQFAATGTLPVGNGFSVIGKAGLAMWSITTSANFVLPSGYSPTGNDFLWGVGAQYDITKAIAVRGFYDSHMLGDSSTTGRYHMNTLNLGLVFKF